MLNLDTHILVFALQGSLRPAEEEVLSQSPWGISGIVHWELACCEDASSRLTIRPTSWN